MTSWSPAADAAVAGLALAAVVSGWRVFRTDSMVRATLWLLGSFLATAGIMLALSAPYLGAALAFMMVLEMLVMALFMVMYMMNPAGLNPMSMVHQPRWALAAGVATFAALGAVGMAGGFADRPVPPDARPVEQLGHELMGPSMLVFESAGVTLLTAMVAAVALSSARGRFTGGDPRPPPLEPGGDRRGDGSGDDERGAGESGHAHHHGHREAGS